MDAKQTTASSSGAWFKDPKKLNLSRNTDCGVLTWLRAIVY
jgi:hypothetical protein